MTFVQSNEHWLAARARATPDAPAILDADSTTSWKALADLAGKMVNGLVAHDVSAGDRIAIRSAPSRELVALIHATQSIGAVSVLLSPNTEEPELDRLLGRTAPRLLILGSSHPAHDVDSEKRVQTIALADLSRDVDGSGLSIGCDEHAAHSILFTSGTATSPKAVVLSNRNHFASAISACRRLEIESRDVWIAAMPMNHVGGLSIILRSAIAGFSVVVQSSFNTEVFDEAVRRHGVTVASLVPTMLGRWLDQIEQKGCPPTFRCALVGGAGIGRQLLERARAVGIAVASTYGLTETASQIATSPVGGAGISGSGVVHSGSPLDGAVVEIEEPDENGVGEIVVSGPQVMSGYLDDQAATDAAIRGSRLYTGDRGRLTEQGNLEVLGRSDEVIITGGENVSPAEVEEVLIEHAQVADAGVYATAHDEWGQAVTAVVVATAGATPDEATLRRWCRERLAGHKVPKQIRFAAGLPRTSSGKLRRPALAELPEA